MKIAIVKPSSLDDIVHTIVFLVNNYLINSSTSIRIPSLKDIGENPKSE